jgi:hypothetical protein
MTLKMTFSPNSVQSDIQLCEDYWAYEQDGRYLEHIEVLCRRYYIDYHILFGILAECQVYLVDVHCEYCRRPYQPDVPADVPYIKKQSSWFCEECINFSRGEIIVGR